MKILFPAAPGYGLLLPVVPLVWAARAAGHEVLLATTAYVTAAAADSDSRPSTSFRTAMSARTCCSHRAARPSAGRRGAGPAAAGLLGGGP